MPIIKRDDSELVLKRLKRALEKLDAHEWWERPEDVMRARYEIKDDLEAARAIIHGID